MATIDAYMRVHNMLVMARPHNCSMDSLELEVFKVDAWWYFSITDDFEEGVNGGESDLRCGSDGNPTRGG